MRGLVEYQNDLYRSVARLTRNDGRVTRLTEREKAELELVFRVGKGSSHLHAPVTDCVNVLRTAVEKLSGRQALIGIVVFLLMFFGTAGVYFYFNHTTELKKIEAEQKGRQFDLQERKDLYEFLEKMIGDKTKEIDAAVRASPIAADISGYNRHGYDEIMRNSSGVDEVVLQGTEISASVIREITRSSRAASEDVVIKGLFTVTMVESDDPEFFSVHLMSQDDGATIVAQLEDPLVRTRYQKAISNAEWSHNPVMVHIVGRRVGDAIKDAKIVKAYAPRARRS